MVSLQALIIYPPNDDAVEEIAREIARGASEAGLRTHLLTTAQQPRVGFYDLVFVGGFIRLGFGFSREVLKLVRECDWQRRRACVFAVNAGWGKQAVEGVAHELQKRGARVLEMLSIELKGLHALLGKGKPSETDLARAHAFGERMARELFGRPPAQKPKEKTRIKGYKKLR